MMESSLSQEDSGAVMGTKEAKIEPFGITLASTVSFNAAAVVKPLALDCRMPGTTLLYMLSAMPTVLVMLRLEELSATLTLTMAEEAGGMQISCCVTRQMLLSLLRLGGDGGCVNVTVLLPALMEAPTCCKRSMPASRRGLRSWTTWNGQDTVA